MYVESRNESQHKRTVDHYSRDAIHEQFLVYQLEFEIKYEIILIPTKTKSAILQDLNEENYKTERKLNNPCMYTVNFNKD